MTDSSAENDYMTDEQRRVLREVDADLRAAVGGAVCTVRVAAGDWTTIEHYVERIIKDREDTEAALRVAIADLADGIAAGTQDFMAGFEKAGKGLSTRMSGETAAVVVQVRAEMEHYVRSLLTTPPGQAASS